ncbi:MAG: RNA-guided endonuclease InsQ/TnpB family protein, partial [Runella sp.]
MKSVKIRIELNHEQTTLARKHAGASRYAYNWALDKCKKSYENRQEHQTYKRPSAIDLHKEWVIFKNSEAIWAKEVSKCSPQEAFRHLDTAYKRAFTVKGAKQQSKNYQKQKRKVAKIHYKISCIRKDALHKLTTYLAKNHSEIVIEDLNVKGMSKNHKLASAILDGGFYEFKRQLEYKTSWYGSKLTVVDRFYPSSKTCSNCQTIKEDLTLKDRVFLCPTCGMQTDRDLNAAINLQKKAVSYTVSNACGEVKLPAA